MHVFSISLGSVRAVGRVHTRTKQRPKPPQPPQPPQAFSRKCVLFFVSLVDEMMTSGQLSASQRRRGRRLRAMLRHEQLSIVLALAAALHHSAGSREKVEIAVQRRPSGTDDREGEVHEKNDAPRRQNTPHPGERSGLLLELGLQRSDRSLRRSSGPGLPRLATPSLAGAAGEGVDSCSLQFLTASLRRKKRRRSR